MKQPQRTWLKFHGTKPWDIFSFLFDNRCKARINLTQEILPTGYPHTSHLAIYQHISHIWEGGRVWKSGNPPRTPLYMPHIDCWLQIGHGSSAAPRMQRCWNVFIMLQLMPCGQCDTCLRHVSHWTQGINCLRHVSHWTQGISCDIIEIKYTYGL